MTEPVRPPIRDRDRKTARHMIVPQGPCPARGTACPAALDLLKRLGVAVSVAAPMMSSDFSMDGEASLPPCAALCWQGRTECALVWSADASGLRLRGAGAEASFLRAVPVPGGVC